MNDSTIKRRYFTISDRALVKDVKQTLAIQFREHTARRADLQRKYEAVALMLGHNKCPIGIVLPETATRPPGMRKIKGVHEVEGVRAVEYRPVMNTKTGRAIYDEMQAVGEISASETITRRFKCNVVAFEGRGMHFSVAGIMKNKLVFSIPETAEYPFTPPDGLKEIKKSAFISLTEE